MWYCQMLRVMKLLCNRDASSCSLPSAAGTLSCTSNCVSGEENRKCSQQHLWTCPPKSRRIWPLCPLSHNKQVAQDKSSPGCISHADVPSDPHLQSSVPTCHPFHRSPCIWVAPVIWAISLAPPGLSPTACKCVLAHRWALFSLWHPQQGLPHSHHPAPAPSTTDLSSLT